MSAAGAARASGPPGARASGPHADGTSALQSRGGMVDVSGYIGLPWRLGGRERDGLDCYGLVRLVLGELWGLWLPRHETGYPPAARDRADLAALVADRRGRDWLGIAREVDGRLVTVMAPWRPGDVLRLRRGGADCHLALLVGPGRMLHIDPHILSVCERLDRWTHRVVEVARHRVLLEAGV